MKSLILEMSWNFFELLPFNEEEQIWIPKSLITKRVSLIIVPWSYRMKMWLIINATINLKPLRSLM